VMELIERLDPARFRPSAIVPGPGPFADWCAARSIPLRVIPWNGWNSRWSLVRGSAFLLQALLTTGAQIVHAVAPPCYRAAGLAAGLAGTARVCHLGLPPAPGEIAWSFQWGPEAVICCYEGQASSLKGEIGAAQPKARVVGIPNGVDILRFRPPREDETAARTRWRFGARHVVLICGHLSDVKGHPTFLRAAARIAAELPGCAFLALGGETAQKGFRAELERLARELGIAALVHFLGFRDDVPAIIQAADVMALPSRDEGLPLAVLEAMACGRPVVSTPVGGVPEAITDGETGLLVQPDDPEALAGAVLRILRDTELARRLGAAARRRVEKQFSLDRFAAQVVDLYEELLAARARS
jgi:glycosyltransferase involved in cell wall biosynthesis